MKQLPFKIEEFEELKAQPEVIVDMSDHNFSPGLIPVKTCFIYLRNIGFTNLKLDFSKTDTASKFLFLKTYLAPETVENSNKEFVDSWMSILTGINYPGSILSDEELDQFRSEYTDYIFEVLNYACSLPVYVINRFNDKEHVCKVDFIEKDKSPVGINFNNVIKHPDFLAVMMIEYDSKEIGFYKDAFTIENNELFEAVLTLPCFAVLFDLATNKDNLVKQILECGKNAKSNESRDNC